MIQISKLRNPVQNYAWGSRTAIATLLGQSVPSAEPQAELWMGAHPKAPSEVRFEGRWTSLAEVIGAAPVEILGPEAVARHGPSLPFLLKVLAAARALSIQAHPDRAQAEIGCRREDERGIPRDGSRRNYRDANPKPEILYAMEPFRILRGFRPPQEILGLLARVELSLPECEALSAGDLRRFFTAYMRLPQGRLEPLLEAALRRAETLAAEDDIFACVADLGRQYPGDRGVLAPLLLHLIELAPGEAMFTGPGVLHAYLEGVGIELMASSDNVVRGGLTAKNVDVGELLHVLRFEPQPPHLLGSTDAGGERCFESVAGKLELARVEVTPQQVYERSGEHGVEILLCTEGEGVVEEPSAGTEVAFAKGESLLVPAAVSSYRVAGAATLFRAAVSR